MTTKPDLSEARTYAEAVAYGKALAVRELLDALNADRPAPVTWQEEKRDYPAGTAWWDVRDDHYWRDDYVRGYDRAKRIVQNYRCGVEKP